MTASVLCEAAEAVATEEEANPRLFALLAGSLYALDNGHPYKDVFIFFVVKLLDILGISPQPEVCVCCGEKSEDRINIREGGFVCGKCHGENVPSYYKKVFNAISMTPSKNISDLLLGCDASALRFFSEWLTSVTQKMPKSLKMLLQICDNRSA